MPLNTLLAWLVSNGMQNLSAIQSFIKALSNKADPSVGSLGSIYSGTHGASIRSLEFGAHPDAASGACSNNHARRQVNDLSYIKALRTAFRERLIDVLSGPIEML